MKTCMLDDFQDTLDKKLITANTQVNCGDKPYQKWHSYYKKLRVGHHLPPWKYLS